VYHSLWPTITAVEAHL